MGKNSLGYSIVLQDGNTWIQYKRISDTEIDVFWNDKRYGSICRVEQGWQFTPRGQKQGDPVLPSLRKVKEQIEGR
jgi:hypothetical protein